MNPNNLSFGSGSPMVGNGGMVANQMEAGAPAMSQMGSNNPAFTPQMQTEAYPPIPVQPSGASQSILPPPPPQPQQQQMPQMNTPASPKTEHHLIIEALSNRLKAITDLEKKLVEAHLGGGAQNGTAA